MYYIYIYIYIYIYKRGILKYVLYIFRTVPPMKMCNRTPQQSSEPEDIYWNGAVSTSNLSGGHRGRDCMVVGFYNYLWNQCLSPLKS